MDKGEYIATIFIDFAKAFDIHGLLHKLQLLGIGGDILGWLENYLSGRKQRVVVNGQFSDWKTPQAGVPQGSVLGPLLFDIYVNDLAQTTDDTNLFADDTSAFSSNKCPSVLQSNLQTSTNSISKWLCDWKLTANETKTKLIVPLLIPDKPLTPHYPERSSH